MSLESLGKLINTYCEPLFMSKHFMLDGHSPNKANGTITYIRYKGVLYGVTCSHVEKQTGDKHILTVHGADRGVHFFGQYGEKGYESFFKILKKEDDPYSPDIAITKLGDNFERLHMENKKKQAINLDQWVEPDWSALKLAMACGYPTEHKEETKNHVASRLIQAIAEVNGEIAPSKDVFNLFSALKEEHNVYFSGMSGGPVFVDGVSPDGVSPSAPCIIGIIFEGSPGSSEEWINRSTDSFLTNHDVYIKAQTLTPTIFESWLVQAGPGMS